MDSNTNNNDKNLKDFNSFNKTVKITFYSLFFALICSGLMIYTCFNLVYNTTASLNGTSFIMGACSSGMFFLIIYATEYQMRKLKERALKDPYLKNHLPKLLNYF